MTDATIHVVPKPRAQRRREAKQAVAEIAAAKPDPEIARLQAENAQLRAIIQQQNATIERVMARFGAAQLNYEQMAAEVERLRAG